MSTFARILAAVCIAAFSVGPVSAATVSNAATTVAQASANSAVSGTVRDDSGAPVTAASVELRGSSTYTSTTDAKGDFAISNVGPGLYDILVSKAGYQSATDTLAVIAGAPTSVDVRMHVATLTSLHTIATVRTAGRGAINTSTAAIDSVPAAAFADQGSPQVTRVLNQIPGVSISLPQTSANGAVPGAITFPNVRGALSFETASLIDGHPLSVGTFGDYVTTFLNSALFQNVEVIKGPGAMSPQVNYAIGGTVNFRTKDPTYDLTPDYSFGIDNHGGSQFNMGVSDTIGRLGFVVDVANYTTNSPLYQYPATYNPNNGVAMINGKQTVLGFNDSAGAVPGTVSQIFNQYGLVACCYSTSGDYASTNELLKARWKFSDATTATISYLGGQTFANQNGNTSSQTPAFFVPSSVNKGVPYSGPFTNGQPVLVTSIHPGGTDQEINNEPIVQAEIRTTLGNDTVLARYYHASIYRLIYQGNANLAPTINSVTLNGTNVTNKVGSSFNNVTVPVAYYDWFNQNETDRLAGLSFEYQHPMTPTSELSFSVDQTNSTTTSFSQGMNSPSTVSANSDQFASVTKAAPSVSVPTGSSQLFTTFLLRYNNDFSDRLTGTLSLYDNLYRSTVPYQCYNPAVGTNTTASCAIDGSNALFTTSNASHGDIRAGLTFRPRNDTIVRFALGSAIAPPYLNLLTKTGAVSYRAGSTSATRTVNAANLLPETAFGYDLGTDHRFGDGVTTISGDVYLTNLYNHFITAISVDPALCTNAFPYANTGCPAAGVPMFDSYNTNVANARFEGLELALRRAPAIGWGYSLAGSTQRGYAYNLPPNFYCTNPSVACVPANYNTNLAVVSGANFTGGGLNNVGPGLNGLSNQNIPYLQGNFELNYKFRNGALVAFGETLYGKNNSLNEPPFGIAYASFIYPMTHSLSLQIAGDNVFNAYPGLFPLTGAGVGIPLAIPGNGATTANNLGPATWRFLLTKNIGP